MNLMIVEDDAHKLTEIKSIIKDLKFKLFTYDNVCTAVNSFDDLIPDRIILDMSLPSHAAISGEGNPLSLPTGGIEIILELSYLSQYDIPILIVTQYPDIEIDGKYYAISESKKPISEKFSMHNVDAVYTDDEEWKNKILEFMRMK